MRPLARLGRDTRAMIVSEGIETQAELHMVRRLGVLFGQGYLLAVHAGGGAAGLGGVPSRRPSPSRSSRASSRMRPCSAGKICLKARSPVAPMNTTASDRSMLIGSTFDLDVPAEPQAHRREYLAGKVSLVMGREARIEGGRQDRCRHAAVDRCDARPATLAGVGHTTREVGA